VVFRRFLIRQTMSDPVPHANAAPDVMADALKISADERLRLAELIRRRSLADPQGRLPVAVIERLLAEVRRGA
jgi:hypothetical protein